MRIMREVLIDLSKRGTTILISSHILGELEKIATHYGIIRNGKMLREMTAEQLNADCPTYVALKTDEIEKTRAILQRAFGRADMDEQTGEIRVYGAHAEDVAKYLFGNFGIVVSEIRTAKISLEEYYEGLMREERK